MKVRFWGVLAIFSALLSLAGAMDWQQATTDYRGLYAATGEVEVLQTCAPSQGNYSGPLIPNQGTTPSTVTELNEIIPEGAITPSAWSARAGFSISYATNPNYWAQMLGSGWYLDWSMRAELPASGPEHWQMVRVHEDCISPSPEAIRRSAARLPGQVWIIGNEPDVIWQDDVTPQRYALVYHALFQLIRMSDPTAIIAVGGVSQATPLRLQYLDQVLATYQERYHEALPTDWWTVHGYVLREQKDSWGVEIPPGIDATQGELYEVSDHGRLDLFEAQLIHFRQWMEHNGYQDTPLALTEFGILMPNSYGFPPQAIADYLQQTFTWLYQAQDQSTGFPGDAYHLIQKWAWFSVSDPNYPSSNLGDITTGMLTLVGEQFRDIVLKQGE